MQALTPQTLPIFFAGGGGIFHENKVRRPFFVGSPVFGATGARPQAHALPRADPALTEGLAPQHLTGEPHPGRSGNDWGKRSHSFPLFLRSPVSRLCAAAHRFQLDKANDMSQAT
jgi:hypothetical protein